MTFAAQKTAKAPDRSGDKSTGTIPGMIVGIGASSGGSSPLLEIAKALQPGKGIAAVAIMHIEQVAGKNPALAALSAASAFEVVEAAEDMEVAADRLYVVPPGKYLSMLDNKFELQDICICKGMRLPIDHFLCSLAVHQGFRCAGVVLSGKEADGTLGLSEIKAAGGRTIVQDPSEAHAPDMPRNAIAAGVVDLTLPAKAIADAILTWAGLVDKNSIPPDEASALRSVLALLRLRAGHDFRCYKHGTLLRRIERRKTITGAKTLTDYLSFLLENEEEVSRLRGDLLIGVTDFFRQPEAWHFLKEKVLPRLMENADASHPLRAWVPACASGKEAYTLAMLLAEAVESSGKKVATQIFATDTDEPALAIARSGIYGEAEVKSVPAPLLRKYFSHKGGRFQVIKKIRECVVFAPQNLTSDPPFSRLDLVSCRNLLIYLDHSVQKKIIAMFHFSLRAGGFLFLGNAETAAGSENLFETVSKKWRMYRRIGSGRPAGLELPMRTPAEPPFARFAVPEPSRRNSLAFLAQQALLERFAPPAAIIDRKGQLLFSHGAIDRFLAVARGESSLNMVEMAREGLRARLRAAIANAAQTNRTSVFTSRIKTGKKTSPVKVTVAPLRAPLAADGLLLTIFEDIPSVKGNRPVAAVASSDSGFRQIEDELKITREELQNSIEQLEASGEEQKASNEEVMAANEELQSTNEELETSKEELQSLNEELNTVNLRLQEKVDELEGTNNDVTNLLTSSSLATVFLDRDLKIKRFTPAVTALLSLIPSDTGRPIGDVVRKFTDDELIPDAKKVLVDLTAMQREVESETGQWFIRRITPYRTQDDRIDGVVVTFSEVTELKRSEKEIRKLADEIWTLARLPAENPNPVLRIGKKGNVLYANDASRPLLKMWDCGAGDAIPDPWRNTVAEIFQDQAQRIEDIECGERVYSFAMVPIFDAGYVNFYGRDVTKRKKAEDKLRESQRQNEFLANIIESSSQPFAVGFPDGKLGLSNKAFELLTGYSSDELRSIDWATALTPPEWFEIEKQKLEELHRTGKPVRYEKEYVRKDGARVPVELLVHLVKDADGKPQYYYSFLTDITERKRAEEALRESEDRFRSITEKISAGIAITRLSDSRMVFANPAYHEMLGFGPGELIGQQAPDLYFDPVERESALQLIKKQGFLKDQPIKLKKNDGSIIWISSTANFFHYNGEPAMMGSAIDITDRRKAEEVLVFQARLLFEVHDAVFSSDSNYSITYWNQAAEKMFGWTKEEAVGKNSGELLKPIAEGSSVDRERSKMHSEGHWQGEAQYIRKDGTYFFTEVNATVLRDASGKDIGNVVVARDITERKRAEAALRESEERYRNLVLHAPAGIYEVDFTTGRFTEVNDVMCQLLGYTRDELLAMTAPEILDEEGRAHFTSRIRKAQEGQKPGEAVEYRVRTKDGRLIWGLLNVTFRWDGERIVGAMVVAHDITERKQAELALWNNIRLLEDVMDGCTSPIFLKDLEGKFISSNASLEKMLGMSRQELKGKTDYDIAPKEVADSWRSNDAKVLATGKAVQVEEQADLLDGRHMFLANKFPLVDAQGRLYGVGSISHDITERKKLEEELQLTLHRFYLMLSSMHLGILLVTDDNKVEFANQAFCDIFGFKDSTDKLLQLSASEMIEKIRPAYQNPDKAVARIREIVDLGQAVNGEDVPLSGNRSFLRDFIPIRIGEQKYGRLWVHREITERKRAEEEVRKSKEQLAAVFDGVSETLMLLDIQGNILAANKVALRRLGQATSGFVGKNLYDFVPAEYHEARKNQISELVHTKKPVKFQDSMGETVLDLTFYPIFDSAGDVCQFVSFALDITERKKAEEQITRDAEAIREKNAELERFNNLMVGRELRMIEIKNEINTLCKKIGEPERYMDLSDESQFNLK